jgi:hypothetical protein
MRLQAASLRRTISAVMDIESCHFAPRAQPAWLAVTIKHEDDNQKRTVPDTIVELPWKWFFAS